MSTKRQAATPLSPMQKFYGTPTPANAVLLAMADHQTHCQPMQPQSEYMEELQKAHERLLAYPKLVDALRKANQFLHDNAPEEDETLALTSGLLRTLGEIE